MLGGGGEGGVPVRRRGSHGCPSPRLGEMYVCVALRSSKLIHFLGKQHVSVPPFPPSLHLSSEAVAGRGIYINATGCWVRCGGEGRGRYSCKRKPWSLDR
ncbi:unnamed protein product [Ectocarpus sp. 12 AP-2014]